MTLKELVDLLISQLLTEVRQEVTEFGRVDGAVLVLVEDSESLDEVVDTGSLLVLADGQQDGQEGLEGDPALWFLVKAALLNLSIRRVLTHSSQYFSKLEVGDFAISLIVEKGESLLEFINLVVRKWSLQTKKSYFNNSSRMLTQKRFE